jgi:hypothetical protein
MKKYEDILDSEIQDSAMVSPMVEETPVEEPGLFSTMMQKLKKSRDDAEAARLQKMTDAQAENAIDPVAEELAKRNDPLYAQEGLDEKFALQKAIKDQTRSPIEPSAPAIVETIPEEIKNYVKKKSLPVAPKTDPSQSLPEPQLDNAEPVQLAAASPDMDMEELRKAQDRAKQGQIMGMFSNISGNVAEATAPGFKANRQFASDIEKVMGQNLADLSGKQAFEKGKIGLEKEKIGLSNEQELNDANSAVSTQARVIAKELMGSEIPPNMTAAQLNKLMPGIQQKASIEARKEESQQRSLDRAAVREAALLNKNATKDLIRQDKLNKDARLSDKQVTAFVDLDNAAADLNNLLTDLGDNKNWVGPIDAAIPDILVGKDQVAFRSEVGKYKDAYRKAITGAGAGPREIAILETRLPTITDTPANFKAKLLAAEEELRRRKQVLADNLGKQGKNVEEFRQGPTATGERSVVKKQYSKSRNQTRIQYSDGTEEILDGKQ